MGKDDLNVNKSSNTSFTIRQAIVDDARELIEYYNFVAGETDYLNFGKGEFSIPLEKEKKYIQDIFNDDTSIILVVLMDNEIVGSLQLISYLRNRLSQNADLSISVKKQYWNKGIGSSLLDQAIDFARKADLKNIFLGVREDNFKAIRLYQKFGFYICGCRKDFFYVNKEYYDEILMQLTLK